MRAIITSPISITGKIIYIFGEHHFKTEDRGVNGNEDKMRVKIFTRHYQVTGVIELFRGARLTDYLAEAGAFIAVTDTEVHDRENQKILTAPFLNVNKDNIEIILPAEPSGTA